MEQWTPLRDYDGYSISDLGRVRNDRRDAVLRTKRSAYGHLFVGLAVNKTQVQRALAKLVAETYIENPRNEYFTTPVHLDGNFANCAAQNLVWRPRWFAQKFTRQFKLQLVESRPIKDIDTGEQFLNAWGPVHKYGLLYMEVVLSVWNGTRVFPNNQRFALIS